MTNEEAMNSAREMLIYRKLEELNKAKQELNKVKQELETYKRALELACDEIMWRECKNVYNYSFYCKTDCETYEACAKNIEWKDYFLKKAKEG